MRDNFDTKHWLSLSLTTGVGAKAMVRLLRGFGSPGAALGAPMEELRHYVGKKTAQNIRTEDRAKQIDAALHWAQKDGRHILTWSDKEFPPLLLETGYAPPVLYAEGNLAFLQKPIVAVVGSRNASAAGNRNAELFSRALSDAGVCVVSGMAQGIDAAAHRGALAGCTASGGGGGTIAVIGTGADIIYPKIHRHLAAEIAQKGALIGELPLGTMPHPTNFPRRNRIISGISLGCLVVEATLKSGSLITAQNAAEQGRDVFAVPGSISSPLHRGCHRLIRDGALLTEKVNDILEALNMPLIAPRLPEAIDYADMAAETGDKLLVAVLSHINYAPTTIDEISERSGLDADALLPELLELEISGKILPAGGGRYQRV